MERSLLHQEYLAGNYSIADMAAWPWIVPYKRFEQNLDAYPNVRRWFDSIKTRPAVQRGMDVGKELRRPSSSTSERTEMSEEQRKFMFGQTGASVAEAARENEE